MNYKGLSFQDLNLDEGSIYFLESHQDEYRKNVLLEDVNLIKDNNIKISQLPIEIENKKEKHDLRSILSDFLFSEKYNTVLDVFKRK